MDLEQGHLGPRHFETTYRGAELGLVRGYDVHSKHEARLHQPTLNIEGLHCRALQALHVGRLPCLEVSTVEKAFSYIEGGTGTHLNSS